MTPGLILAAIYALGAIAVAEIAYATYIPDDPNTPPRPRTIAALATVLGLLWPICILAALGHGIYQSQKGRD